MLKTYFILPLTLFLFACATTSSESNSYVENSDWKALGSFDGSEGLPEKSNEQLQTLSEELNGGEVDYNLYQENYLAEVTVYCEPNNARMLALKGKPYHHVCERFPNGGFFYQDYLNANREGK